MIQFLNIELNYLPERYNEALLQKTQLTQEENDFVMKKLNLTF